MSKVFKAVTVVSVISLLLVSGFVSLKLVQHATSTPAGPSAPWLAILAPPHRDAADTAGLSTATAHATADSALAYGTYDRVAAYNYAQKYWDEVCSDGYFVNTRTSYIRLDSGTDITGMTGYDCAHFVSCCIGSEPHDPGGGLDVPRTMPLIYGELGAHQLGDWLVTSGNGVEKTTVSELMMGDVINYDWDGDGHWDHAALYLDNGRVAGHTSCVWDAAWPLIGAADYRFVHILGTPWTVDDDGPADFHTVQEAINAATAGDTILVRNGTYCETVVVNKTLSLVGESKHAAVVDGGTMEYNVEVLADNVTIRGFTFQNLSALYIDGYGNMTFSGNIMIGNYQGIRLVRTSGNLISDNLIAGNSLGAIGFDWANNTQVHNNTLTRSGTLGAVHGGNASYNNTFSANTFTGNDVAIEMNGIFNHSRFFHNNFIDNPVQVKFYGPVKVNSWNTECEGNFWSDYTGNDTDGDGIGDTPYVIDGNNQDTFPLMNPYWTPADIDHDLDVDIFDLVVACNAYGATPLDPHWNPHCDIAEPYGVINIFDLVMMCNCYGEEYRP